MASGSSSTDIASRVSRLSLETSSLKSKPQPKAKKATAVADSWEDEDISSDSDGDSEGPSSEDQSGGKRLDEEKLRNGGQAGTAAPPPTPMSPTYGSQRPFSPTAVSGPAFGLPYDTGADINSRRPLSQDLKRPEKTDAVARRMIASALGVKVPKRTEEEKAYDKAIREKERRRREEEKEHEKRREEEAAKAKQAAWED